MSGYEANTGRDSEVESLVLLQDETSSSPESSKSGKIRDSFYWILVSVDFQINDTFPLPDLICSIILIKNY